MTDRAGVVAGPPHGVPSGSDAERHELDLRGVPCPLNWVRTRLALEGMPAGSELAVLLDPGEARESVPRSAREDGHVAEYDGDVLRIVRR